MLTRMGTKVRQIGAVDADGYVDVLLEWNGGNTDARKVHLGDLRIETDDDREIVERLSLAVVEQGYTGRTYYDYDRQAWIKNGRVAKCGHRSPKADCYACQYARLEKLRDIAANGDISEEAADELDKLESRDW